jgi:membrane-associated protease RseP (regulator of RpoE activity)
VADSFPNSSVTSQPVPSDWRTAPAPSYYAQVRPKQPTRSFVLASSLFVITLCTCLVSGTQFAVAYAHNQAVSFAEFARALTLLYRHPFALAGGLPFALTLMIILLAHELGHYFACRHHHIRASYPFFIPAPTLIGTFGAFILIRSPIRTSRALFDVGASGPLVGFLLAIPALVYGIVRAKVVPGLPDHSDVVFGIPLILRLFGAVFHPDVPAANLLLHPVGRAAWVGLFATSLNLLPAGQLDGGHILRSLNARAHRVISLAVPIVLLALGFLQFLYDAPWYGWFIWAALLLGLRFLRPAPVYDPTPLDPNRRFLALLTLFVFILCFMPAPI